MLLILPPPCSDRLAGVPNEVNKALLNVLKAKLTNCSSLPLSFNNRLAGVPNKVNKA